MSTTGKNSKVVVRPHPQGGYTHAVQVTGTARRYVGWWPRKGLARSALTGGAS
jgi:hypothetical protein